ncbi:hypothetical protein FGG90_11475 [Clavibacter tessellarius]|uniref:Uncharacterized protein n=1 Tax=Clavibacter tessellarius TaxID=31965 RepID=A0A225CCI9_9MICO|nr:hypothetical protein [Clavibacter michiganensis]MBT1635021.1 hypothetical protein [Clavibacter michiganensis]OQJ62451.1 hypothetical protein B5P24_05245 [Clavibacter michiganensis subsp. tessellarius]UKF34556.1 hypothetical protein FGG90_11475 [Clavibacter michiganensis subsp. tessellarius]
MKRPTLILYLVMLAVEVILAVLGLNYMEDGALKIIILGLLVVAIVMTAIVVVRGSVQVGKTRK